MVRFGSADLWTNALGVKRVRGSVSPRSRGRPKPKQAQNYQNSKICPRLHMGQKWVRLQRVLILSTLCRSTNAGEGTSAERIVIWSAQLDEKPPTAGERTVGGLCHACPNPIPVRALYAIIAAPRSEIITLAATRGLEASLLPPDGGSLELQLSESHSEQVNPS